MSIENGIWLCQNCAKLADNDPLRYTADMLRKWRTEREDAALEEVGLAHTPAHSDTTDASLLIREICAREATLGVSDQPFAWSLWVQMYISTARNTEFDIPFHNVRVTLSELDSNDRPFQDSPVHAAAEARFIVSEEYATSPNPRVYATRSELTLRGAGRVKLLAANDSVGLTPMVLS